MRKNMATNENLPVTTNSVALLPAQHEFAMFQTIARSAKASGLYGGDENKIFMVMLAARELGISPMLALNGGIWNIQGKIEISARLMNSMIRRAGHTMSIKSTATECTIIGKRCDTEEEHTETFTWAMAEKAGLIRKNRDGSDGIWLKYPEDMLYNRCISRLARRLFADVIGIAYVEGEIAEATDVEKKMPVAQYEDITPEPEPIQKISDEQYVELIDKIKQVDDTCITNMCKYLKDTYAVEDYKDIPIVAYQSCMKALVKNIERNKQAQAA